MSLVQDLSIKIRRGEGPFWARAKRTAKGIAQFSIPVGPMSKPLFGLLYQLHVFTRSLILSLLRVFWYEPIFKSQCRTVGPGFTMGKLVFLQGAGNIDIGTNVMLCGKSNIGFCNRVLDRPTLRIGDATFVGHNCSLYVAHSVEIGCHCLIAGGVIIRDYDGHPTDATARRSHRPVSMDSVRSVIIGDDVWIGQGAVILKGVTIGDRSIVAACSVVTKDVLPDSIVAGNPARVVKSLATPERCD
jgi:serine acetyltransferase